MGLTSIREFYQQSDDKSIKLYQEYLAAVKKEISEGMVEAKKLFGDKDNVVIQIGEKICFIERIEKIIANSLKEIVSNSIINMSDSELLKIIGEHINGLKQEREESVKSLEALKKEKEQKSSDYVNKMNQLGYDVNFYKNVDVEDFFKEIKSASEYIMDLVRTDLDKDALRATFSWLYASTDVQEMLADMILSLRKIAKISDEGVVKKAISTFLTPEKFGRIVGIKEKNECLKSFELLQKELKMRTEFFERLPENLKDEITKQGIMEGETYHNLEELYREYLSTGGIYIPKNAGVSKIEIEIDEIKAVIDELDKKIEKAQSACESRKGMTTLVRSFIHFGEEDDYTYSEIKDETLEYRRMCQKINDRITELTQREETLEEIENKLEMLTSMDEYTSCFDILEAKRELEIMESLTGDYKDEEIKSIALAERRRLRQFEILGSGIASLNYIKGQIEEVDNNRNIIKNIMGTNKKLIEGLLEEYKNKIDEIYSDLNENGLLFINVERSSLDVEEETTRKPINFDTLLMKSNIPQYTVDEELFDELRVKGMVGEYYLPDTLNRDFNKAYVLALKLFQASKSLNGIYDFEISLEEIDELLALYRNLVDIYELLYATREAEKSNIKKLASHELSEKFKKLVADLKLDLSTITLEDVEEYRQDVKNQISDIRNELTVVRGELPNNDYMDSQYDILAGFDETCLPSDEIEKIVSLH